VGICISGNGPTLAAPYGGETLSWEEDVPDDEGSSLFIPRLKEFKRRFPDAWKEDASIFSCPEYLIHKLTGARVTILPQESFRTAYWTAESLKDAGFSETDISKLPPFVKPGDKAGCLSEGIYPVVKKGTPVYCGAADFISAMVGTNSLSPGSLCDRAGSSEGINLCTEIPLEGDEIRTLPSVVPGLWNASFLLPESGDKFRKFKDEAERKLFTDIGFNELVHSCIYNPSGEAIFDQGKYLMLQTAMQVRDGLKCLLSLADEKGIKLPTRMTVTGGQAANDEWNQMKANVTGMTIAVPECTDAELVGDAVFAFTGMGIFSSIQEGAKNLHSIAKIFEPEAF
ncbi:MAG: hypothetical protein IJU95_10570, partial [Treponema sp.]|nr:hypothetical protein [Treponema sp.]